MTAALRPVSPSHPVPRPITAPVPMDREQLLTQNIGLVHHVARRMAARLSTAADMDELVSAGCLGLIQAADSFDRRRGLTFSTYAVPRIRGAILDELRRQDHLPRNVRRRMRHLSRARDVLAVALNRQPREAELSRLLEVPEEVLRKWELDGESGTVCSIDQRRSVDVADGTVTLADTIADDREIAVDDRLTREQELARVRAAIAQLKPQERTVLALSYFEELKLQEIATVLGVSVCRVSQIRTAALSRLRESLKGLRAA
ncbi:MAG TPA: FliA/WhiG family RNA polymerase sigma factor [Gemmatimonadaceae bacterium]|nr:FliA/WhiG family RNA polymerase sigma factor [Gemmatimonadaceae bacterium]